MKELYVEKTSLIHSLDFWTKFLCLLLLIPLSGFIASWKLLPAVFLFFIILMVLSKISFRTFWNSMKLYSIAITAGVIILALLFSQGSLMNRLIEGLILSIRFIVLISLGILFAMVTNPIEIPLGLMRVKIPHKYGITVMVAFRMFPLITQKIGNIVDAQRARGARLEFSMRGLPKFFPQVASLMVPALYSTLETSVKLSDTLLSRGYNPDGKITLPPGKFKKSDYYVLVLSVALLIITFIRI